MKGFYRLFGFYPDVKFLILLLALFLLCIPEIIRYRIRAYLDEWVMNLIIKSKKAKKEARKMRKLVVFFIALGTVMFFAGQVIAQARSGDCNRYQRSYREGRHQNHRHERRENFYRDGHSVRRYQYDRGYDCRHNFSYRYRERWLMRHHRYWDCRYYDYPRFMPYQPKIWIPGYWDCQWTPWGWEWIWIPGFWDYGR